MDEETVTERGGVWWKIAVLFAVWMLAHTILLLWVAALVLENRAVLMAIEGTLSS